MAMSGDYLYRVLRDDEDPLRDGIMGKCPTRDKDPAYHIRQCSSPYKMCQWISTCANDEGLKRMLHLKTKQIAKENDSDDDDVIIRHVVIDRDKLEHYADKCRRSIDDNDALLEVVGESIVRIVPYREKTGRLLDFTKESVVERYLPERPKGNIPRNYASKYKEVLVERFIPPHCCIEVRRTNANKQVLNTFTEDLKMSLDLSCFDNNVIESKRFLLESEFYYRDTSRFRLYD